MAIRGRPIDIGTMKRIQRLLRFLGIRATAREAEVSRNTVRKVARSPLLFKFDPPRS